MSPVPGALPIIDIARIGLDELRKSWGWFVALGLLLVVLGTVAIGSAVAVTVVSVALLGGILIAAGVMETVHAFWRRQWSGFFLELLSGLLYLVLGAMMLATPVEAAITLTLLIGGLLIMEGAFRIILSIAVRFPHWPWILLNGVVSLALGICIWKKWPVDALYIIGLFIGIDMIFNGWSLVMLGLAARKLPRMEAAA